MDVSSLKKNMGPYFHDQCRVLRTTPEEEQAVQDYLQGMAQKLMKDDWDFERYPVYFCIVDEAQPNAAFVRPESESDGSRKIPSVFVTKGVLEAVENEDQLAFVLGHELGHLQEYILRDKHGISKAEEGNSDYTSLKRLADAGYNINEARAFASYLFQNEATYPDLVERLKQALDAHPNNESRMNAIDGEILKIEREAQKRNQDLNAVKPTELPNEILDISHKNKHASSFEMVLDKHGYFEADLRTKGDILLSSIDEYITFASQQNYSHKFVQSQLAQAMMNHIDVLRQNMPGIVIKESDRNRLIDLRNRSDEARKFWAEIVPDYPYPSYSGFNSETYLKNMPFRIVKDEEYESAVAFEKEALRKWNNDIANGQNPNLDFWNKWIPYNTSWITDSHKSSYHPIGYAYEGTILNGVLNADLNQYEVGRRFWSEIRKIKENAPDVDQKLIDTVMSSADNYTLNDHHLCPKLSYTETSAPVNRVFRLNQESDLGLSADISDVDKNIPAFAWYAKHVGNFSFDPNSLTLFNIGMHQKITDDLHVFGLQKDEKLWCYFTNPEGKVLDSFPKEQYAEKMEALVEKDRERIYKEVAGDLKNYATLLQEIKTNPERFLERPHASYDLETLKQFVGRWQTQYDPSLTTDLEKYEAESDENNPLTHHYSDNGLSFLRSNFYTHQQTSPFSTLRSEGFDEKRLWPYLNDQEKQLLSTDYRSEDDQAVFEVSLQYIQRNTDPDKKFSDPAWHTVNNPMACSYEDFLSSTVCVPYYTRPQLKRLYDTILSNMSAHPSMKKTYPFFFQNAIRDSEKKNLAAFVARKQAEQPSVRLDDLDLSDYKSLYSEKLRTVMDIPERLEDFDPTRVKDHDDYLYQDRLSFVLEQLATEQILTDKEHRFPMKMLKEVKIGNLDVLLKPRLVPFLTNPQNWPEDTLETVRLYNELYGDKLFSPVNRGLIDYRTSGDYMIGRIHQEQDPQKAIEETILLAKMVDKGSLEEKDSFKNRLLADNPALSKTAYDKQARDRQEQGDPLFHNNLLGRISAYHRLAEENVFPEDGVLQTALLKEFLQDIEKIPNPEDRQQIYATFITDKHRLADPDLRREYQHQWVRSVFEACGRQIDDNSQELHDKIQPYLDFLYASTTKTVAYETVTENNVNLADRMEIAKELADVFVAQQDLAYKIRPEPSSFSEMEEGNVTKSHFNIIVFDLIKREIQSDPKEADQAIEFLLSKGQMSYCESYAEHLDEAYAKRMGDYYGDETRKDVSPQNLQLMHREFWGYPLEARAVLINELLHSANSRRPSGKEKWEGVFDKVVTKVFHTEDEQMNNIGREFLHSYIKSRKDSERTFYLAAMMVAANENSDTTDPEKSVAKGIRLFLENSGPAAIKLGQAMASYTDVPKFIRDEMQELKSSAARPSRWELYEWLDFYKKEAGDTGLDYGKDVWLGRILGSASYFVTLEKGKFDQGKPPAESETVMKVLRAGARISSDKEFKIFENMLYDLGEKGVLQNGFDSFLRLVGQAKDSVKVETDLQIGHDQLETAKKLYRESEIKADGQTFKLHVADWPTYGENWADLERAKGLDLDQIKDPAYKKAVSKAYFTVELMNMLSGGRFDHDRHGKQLKIDPETNVIGLFDTGAMAVVDPDPKDKELLGQIIYRTLEKSASLSQENSGLNGIGSILSDEIEKVYQRGETTSTYLTECQRGLLALTDFYGGLNAEDFTQCLNSAINNPDMPVDSSLIKGFVGESIKSVGVFETEQPLLSYEDKERLGALLFNVYAESLNPDKKNIGQTIESEIQKMKQKTTTPLPLLDVISNHLHDQTSGFSGLSLPKEFMPTVSELIGRQNIDVGILKGMMKEVIYTVDLQSEKTKFSPEDRREFGRLMYDTYEQMLKDGKEGKSTDMAKTFLKLQQSGEYKSDYANRVSAVIKIASQADMSEHKNGLDFKNAVKSVLLSGKMDSEITAGIAEALKQRNPNSLSRQMAAKGLTMFLSQRQAEPNVLKKALIKMFVKPKVSTAQIRDSLIQTAVSPEQNRNVIRVLKNYADKVSRLVNQKNVAPQIQINAGRSGLSNS